MHIDLFSQIATDSVQEALNKIATSTVTEKSLSIFELVAYGGWAIMGPLALMSLVTIYILIERMISLRSAISLDKDFLNKVRDYVHEGKLDSARNLCATARSPAARMVEKGINRFGSPVREIEAAMEGVGRTEIGRLERGVGLLSLFSKLAPMFGFIGTIIGVIKIFYEIALADNISIGIIAGGLYQKMITSAAGLIVGMMAFTAYFIINNLVDRAEALMDDTGQQFLDIIQEPQKA